MNTLNILAPDLPESVTDATVTIWHKKPGDSVTRGEVLLEIETDKVVLEVPAPKNGVLDMIMKDKGTVVFSRQILGRLREYSKSDKNFISKFEEKTFTQTQFQQEDNALDKDSNDYNQEISCREKLDNIKSTNFNNCLVYKNFDNYPKKPESDKKDEIKTSVEKQLSSRLHSNARREKRVPMTRIRRRIAERLLEAKNSTAMLTTFNEVNMKSIIELRKQYGMEFKKRHTIRLSFMSFYVKAVVKALKRYPEMNSFIDANDIVYHNYFDISIAVSTTRGLVTPVLRNVDTLCMADIERKIKKLALKGRNGKLTINDLTGGNFTITNGGVFGSLISTPIINPPQSAILGIHAVKDRPMAVNNKVKILPMMYLALSYDHRLIDGYESVSFLTTVKELLEDPTRLLLDI